MADFVKQNEMFWKKNEKPERGFKYTVYVGLEVYVLILIL